MPTLAEIFYDAPPVKEFRKRYHLTKVGGKKHLLAALLKAYKQWGGAQEAEYRHRRVPHPFQTGGHSEYELFRDYFRKEGYNVEIVSPEQLEYRNRVLRKGNFEINWYTAASACRNFCCGSIFRIPWCRRIAIAPFAW